LGETPKVQNFLKKNGANQRASFGPKRKKIKKNSENGLNVFHLRVKRKKGGR
jgi:hypothetical protein